MTEEIIIGKKDVASCNYWKACDYYKQLKRLEQENKELKELNIEYDEELAIEKLSHKSDLETLECYRSALEEIRTYLNTLSSIDNDFPNTETYLRIQTKINEVIYE